MNEPLWAAIREYIDAEVKLAVVRFHHYEAASGPYVRAKLEEQSTRMETEVRRLIAATDRTAKGG